MVGSEAFQEEMEPHPGAETHRGDSGTTKLYSATHSSPHGKTPDY